MKAQSRSAAVKESALNIAAGIGLSTALNLALLPLVRMWPLWQATALLVGAFTVASFARSYALRRIFEHFRTRNTPPFFEDIVAEIAAERMRQIHGEGFSLAHDDEHKDGELAAAAAAYAYAASRPRWQREMFGDLTGGVRNLPAAARIRAMFPASWSTSWFKPTHPRRDLIKAGALIVAEIGRLDRARRRGTL